jgi:four helix bundle protein
LEVETQLLIASKLGYFSNTDLRRFMDNSGEVSRMLHRLIESVSEPEGDSPTRN